MGQYYTPINLDKRERLDAYVFGDGSKLLEFGVSSCGTMTAMAILLSSGNGRGGGDLHIGHLKQENPSLYSLAQKYVGRWAGDRIVIAGDYDDTDKFMNFSNAELRIAWERGEKAKQKEAKQFRGTYKPKPMSFEEFLNHANLYRVANRLFDDISNDMLCVMCIDSYVKESIAEIFAHGRFDKNKYKKLLKYFPEIAKSERRRVAV